MKTMMSMIWVGMLFFATAAAEDQGVAALELKQAKEALRDGRYVEARKSLARIQAFYYRDAELMPEALYYEAWIDHRAGGLMATVSALDELYALYPSSLWSTKARAEFEMEEAAE